MNIEELKRLAEPPDYLIERMDKAIEMLRDEVLEDVK